MIVYYSDQSEIRRHVHFVEKAILINIHAFTLITSSKDLRNRYRVHGIGPVTFHFTDEMDIASRDSISLSTFEYLARAFRRLQNQYVPRFSDFA
jgi:hypothetical protein